MVFTHKSQEEMRRPGLDGTWGLYLLLCNGWDGGVGSGHPVPSVATGPRFSGRMVMGMSGWAGASLWRGGGCPYWWRPHKWKGTESRLGAAVPPGDEVELAGEGGSPKSRSRGAGNRRWGDAVTTFCCFSNYVPRRK